MSDNELRNKILDVIIKAHTDVSIDKGSPEYLLTYDEVKENFGDLENEYFYNQFLIVREEWLETILLSDIKKVYREIGGARFFLYAEEGYIGREKKRKMTENVAKATRNSSIAAISSVVIAFILAIVTIFNSFFKEDEFTPLLIKVQEQARVREANLIELQTELQLLKAKMQELETQKVNTDTLPSMPKTHK